MKKLFHLYLVIITLVLASCGTLAPANQTVKTAVNTIDVVIKTSIIAVCAMPESTTAVNFVADINQSIQPNTISVSCPMQTVPVVGTPSIKKFSNMEIDTIKGLVLAYCNQPLIGYSMVQGLLKDIEPISITLQCN